MSRGRLVGPATTEGGRSSWPRPTLVLVGAAAVGALLALVKGQAGDGVSTLDVVRFAVGNLSAPWLVLPLVVGSGALTLPRGALRGLAGTLVALAAFYAVTAGVVRLDGTGFLRSWVGWASAGRGYVEGGLVTGPLLGASGVWWRRRHGGRLRPLLPVGLLLLGEPVVLALGGRVGGAAPGAPVLVRVLLGFGIGPGVDPHVLVVYAAEAVLGVAALVAVAVGRRARRTR